MNVVRVYIVNRHFKLLLCGYCYIFLILRLLTRLENVNDIQMIGIYYLINFISLFHVTDHSKLRTLSQFL